MRKIPLGQSRKEYAIVDSKDYKQVMRYMWHKSICGAAQRRPRKKGRRKCIFLHQEILEIIGRKKRVIHINGNRLDCRRKNLQIMGKKYVAAADAK